MKTLDCMLSGQHLKSCDDDGFCNNCGNQETLHFYEIHVVGKNGFSTTVITEDEKDEEEIIMLAYEEDKLHDDDCHYVDYVLELSIDEWDKWFNYNKK